MKDQEKIIVLLNDIDKFVDYEHFEDDLRFDDGSILDIFSDRLLEIFEDGLNENILKMILKLDVRNIFRINNGNRYRDNKIRKEIEEYLNNNEKLYLDYSLIKKNIKKNYNLVKYLKEKEKILDLIDLNENVLLFIESKYATKEFILQQMQKSDFISLVFLGWYGKDNVIYKYSDFYEDIPEISDLLYEQLKDKLINDCSLYINASELVKKNKKIKELVLSIDRKMEVYIIN